MEVASFDEGSRIVIPHVSEGLFRHVQGFSTQHDTSMIKREVQPAIGVYNRIFGKA